MKSKRKSLAAGYEINPATGRKRKSCRPDQVRDQQTGRCKNVRSKSKRKSLASGYEINPATGRKRKSCRPDQVRDQQTGRCKNVRSKSRKSNKKKSMSPKKKSMSPGQQLAECTVCYDETNSKVPGCNHPLCPSCFNGMRQSGRTISCPICRLRFNNLNNGFSKKKSVSPKKKKSKKKSVSPVRNRCSVCNNETMTIVHGCNHPLCPECYHVMRTNSRNRPLNCQLCRHRFNYLDTLF